MGQAISGYSMSSHLPDKGWHAHNLGIETLVRLRGRGQLSTTRGIKLFRIAQAAIVRLTGIKYAKHRYTVLKLCSKSGRCSLVKNCQRISRTW